MTHVRGLRCRACGEEADAGGAGQACARCWGPLELVYDLRPGGLDRAAVAAGPPTMWRWAPLLPTPDDLTRGLGVGHTPLVPAERLAAELGLGEVWLKDETRNPTRSFKDRVVATALGRARQLGMATAACASTGNLGDAVAALAARAGMGAVVLLPASLDPRRRLLPAASGAAVVAVDGSYDRVNRLSVELAEERPDWAWVNVALRPWYVDGARTLAWEVVEQLGWEEPDHVVCCMASGALVAKLHQGFSELRALGLVPADRPPPRVTVVQPAGSAAVAAAVAAGARDITPVRPDTVAESLAMGDPPDADAVLAAVRATGGTAVAVPEEEIGPAQARLARTEGVVAEPAGGVVVAGLAALAAAGTVRPDERVVVYVTGGAKDLRGLAAAVPEPPVVSAEPGAVVAAVEAAARRWA